MSSVNPAARSSCRLKSHSRCHQETQASHPQNQLGGSFLQLHLGIKRGWEQSMWALYKGSSADASTTLPRGSRSAFTSLGSCRTYPRARGMNALTAICKMILNPGSPKEVSECCRHWDWMLWTYFSGIDWPENCTGQRPCMCSLDPRFRKCGRNATYGTQSNWHNIGMKCSRHCVERNFSRPLINGPRTFIDPS